MKLNVLLLVTSSSDDVPDWKSVNWIVKTKPTLEQFHQIVALEKPGLILSTGNKDTWMHLFSTPFHICKRWCHFDDPTQFPSDENTLLQLYLKNNLDHPLDASRPLISVITTTFHSKHRILRPYHSLQSQTYDNWEWIVWDDSTNDETYRELVEFANQDTRIRVFKAPDHSGFIGDMKQRACGLTRGQWIVELDHDDIIVPSLLQWIVEIHTKYPHAEFIYSDCVELYEDTEAPFFYGDFYAFGYGAYVRQYIRGKYHYVAQSSLINPITLQHLVGLPNHVRIWKSTTYSEIRKHHETLPVVDDYDLLLKSFLHAKETTADPKWIRIVAPAYFQFRNTGGNNFTFLRNDLIQKLVPLIHNMYLPQLREKYHQLGWTNSPIHALNRPVWEIMDETPTFSSIETSFVPEDQDASNPCVSIVLCSEEFLAQDISNVVRQSYQNWILFIIASKSSSLDQTMQAFQDSRIRYHNLSRDTDLDTRIQYAKTMLVRTKLMLVYTSTQGNSDWETPSYLQTYIDSFT